MLKRNSGPDRAALLDEARSVPPPETGEPSVALEQVENMLLYLLARASSEASDPFHAALKARGLAVIEGRILNLLATGTFTVGALAERALAKQTTVTMALERMRRQGYLESFRDREDRRRSNIRLTDLGQRLAEQVNILALEREDELLSGYGPQEVEQLKEVLRLLIARGRNEKGGDEDDEGAR